MKYFRACLYGEQGAGKTATATTLTPGPGTCLIRTRPHSQYLSVMEGTRIAPVDEKAYRIQEFLNFLKNPQLLFKDNIQTLVIDDVSALEIVGLDDYGLAEKKDAGKDARSAYHDLQLHFGPLFIDLAYRPFNLVVVCQCKTIRDEKGNVIEVILDVHDKLKNIVLSNLDYCFFVERNPKFGEAPSLITYGTLHRTKLRLPPSQWKTPPVKQREVADLGQIWAKLQGGK